MKIPLPVFRSHGTDTPREPWAFGPESSLEYCCLQKTIAMRYRLLPYLYSTAAQSCRDGIPMIRAMFIAFGGNPQAVGLSDQYMLGDSLLVKPVTRPINNGGNETTVFLPEGGWYDLFTEKYHVGGTSLTLETPLDRFPVLVHAGSILPLSAGGCCTADLQSPADELLIFEGADGDFILYDDAGDGMEYLEGAYLRIPLHWNNSSRALLIGEAEGSYPVSTCLQVRLLYTDGNCTVRSLQYDGATVCLAFR